MNSTESDSEDIMKIINKKFLINEWRDTTQQKVSGIYKIVNKINGKYYVGSSKNINIRWNAHIRHLNKNIHNNKHLQNAWNKYGENMFTFEIVEIVCSELLLNVEQHYLSLIKNDFINQRDTHYNVTYNALSPTLGKKLSNETKEKISKSLLGKKLSDETKEKIKISSVGRKLTENTKLKISSNLQNKKRKSYPRKKHTKNICNKISSSLKEFYYKNPEKIKIGNMNPNADNTKYYWINYKQNKSEIATKWEMYTKYGINPNTLRKLKSGKLKSVKGWTIKLYESLIQSPSSYQPE
jgi:group I intron endonuclease